MPLHPGERVDRYEILGFLGAGGMGDVYRANDPRLQRHVALKVLHPEPNQDGLGSKNPTGGAARILREARAAAALEHPNVVAIYDVGEASEPEALRGTTYLAMELIRGKPLREYIGKDSPDLRERLRWLTDIARALGAAHKSGLVHRDVKPENVMIRDDGMVKVLDFGIAKRQHSSIVTATSSTEAQIIPTITAKGMVVGTPYYMAPEQMRSDALDGRADQFSWAVVAYETLCGKPPWKTEGDVLQLVAEVLSARAAPPSSMNPAVTPEIDAVILKALSKDPASRFASMEEIVALLDPKVDPLGVTRMQLVSHPPKDTSSPSLPHVPTEPFPAPPLPVPRRISRTPRILTAMAAASLAIVGVVAMERAKKISHVEPAPAVIARECTANADCHGSKDAPKICRADGTCASLASEDCKPLADDRALASADTVWFGAMYPLSGDDASFGKIEARAVDLARDDFASLTSALQGARAVRPIGVVMCDDAVEPNRAARHLVSDVGVPAVMGFRNGNEVMDLAGSMLIPRGVLAMATLSASPLVTKVPQSPGSARLIWRTTYNLAMTAEAIGRFVERDLEPAARERQDVRVAIVRSKVAGKLAFSQAVLDTLTLNGKRALDDAAHFREIVVDEGSSQAPPASWAEGSRMLLDFAPDVVVYIGTDEAFKQVIETADASWPRGRARPTYVVPSALSPETLAYIGSSAERRHRFFGVTTRSTTAANAHFVMHYNEASTEHVTRTFSPNASYDAFYVLAYAAYVVGGAAVSGDALSRAIDHLVPPGVPIEVGPTHIFDAIEVLRRGEHVDLDGAVGRLDFDRKRGEAPVDFAILCVDVDSRGRAVDGVESGVFYDATSRALTGVARCP